MSPYGGILMALLVSGCANAGPDQATVDATLAHCRATHRTYVPRAQCINEAELRQFPASRDNDLFRLRQAERLAMARRVDRGELTYEEGNTEWARIETRIASEAHRRQSAEAMVWAQRAAAISAAIPEPPRSVVCRTTNGITICN
jgi:hypothetical protein